MVDDLKRSGYLIYNNYELRASLFSWGRAELDVAQLEIEGIFELPDEAGQRRVRRDRLVVGLWTQQVSGRSPNES